MAKAKLIAALVLAALVVTVVLQNTQSVETKFLFATLTMPRAALLGVTLLIGIVIGMLVSLLLSGRKAKKAKEAEERKAD